MKKQRILVAIACLALAQGLALGAEGDRFDIAKQGAVGDGKTLNTKAIQATIDACAAAGGGTVVVPQGTFISGALFLKPGVNLELSEGAVLKNSTEIEDFPVRPNTRFEGHFADWRSSLLNGEQVDHLRITGPGTLDGSGAAYWNAKTPQGRPRLCSIRDSSDVVVSGVHFETSASWNLHFYNCRKVLVENTRFEIPLDSKGPSTDGVDIDSSGEVVVRGCFFNVNDDCVCLKGNRYDGLDQKPESPPVENVHVTDCTFVRGMGVLTLGTEAQQIRDVEIDHCRVKGNIPMLRLKLRPDTPGQLYENIRVHDMTLEGGTGKILSFELTHGTKVAAPRPPRDVMRNIVVSDIKGTYGSLGKIAANANTDISDITLKNWDVTVKNAELAAEGVKQLTLDNVVVNGKPLTAADVKQ